MASLATDEEFEHEMLTAHAEDTFIDNLQILAESPNLLEALAMSQSLYKDVVLLKYNPILVKKNDKLKGITPFDLIDRLGSILGGRYDEMTLKTENQKKQLLVIRSEIQSRELALMDDRKSAKQFNKEKRIVTIDGLIANLQEKEEANLKQLQQVQLIIVDNENAGILLNTLKTIKNLLNDAETQYASQEAQKSLIAGEEEKDAQEKAVKAKKEREKEKKRAKKERRRQRLIEEVDRKMAEEKLPVEKEKAEEEIEEAPLEEQPQKPEEGKLKEEEKEVPFTKQIDDIITRLLELHTYGDSLGENFWNNERNKRKAQLKESSKYHAEAVDYLELLQNFLKNSGYKLVVTGGYALRLMTQNLPEYTSKPYKTDDIDVKVCPEEGVGNIVDMRHIVADMIKKTPTFLTSIDGTFFDSSTPDTAGDGNTPLKITAPINTAALGQFRDQRLATILKNKNLDDRQAPIIEITFSSEPCENTTEIKGLNVLDISQLVNNLLNATNNFQERIIAREEGRSRESIYPSKVASWYWQLHQILKILSPHGAIYFSEKLKEETDKKVASSGGRKTKRRRKSRKKKTKRRRKARKKKTKRRRKVKRRKKSRKK